MSASRTSPGAVDSETARRINAAWRRAGRPTPDDELPWLRIAGAAGLEPEELRPLRIALARRWEEQGGAVEPFSPADLRQLAALEAGGRQTPTVRGRGWTVRLDAKTDRVVVTVDDTDDPMTRSGLRAAGFRWSSTSSAWVRRAGGDAWLAGIRAVRGARMTRRGAARPTERGTPC